MNNNVYAYFQIRASWHGLYQKIAAVAKQGIRGLYLLIPGPKVPSKVTKIAEVCKGLGLEFILGYCYIPARSQSRQLTEHLSSPKFSNDLEQLGRVMKLTTKLALANGDKGEFYGDALLAQDYLDDAERMGYEWVCSLSYYPLLYDMRTFSLQHSLRDTQIFCLGGHDLVGYAFGDPALPFWSEKFVRHDWSKEYPGFTVARLQQWLQRMNIWCGAGYQKGLDAGSRVYAKGLGFKDVIVGLPFDLKDSMKARNRKIKP